MTKEFDMKTFHEGLQHADYVVGHYGPNGGLLKAGGLAGDADALLEHRKAFASSAGRVKGAELLKPVKKPAKAKSKQKKAKSRYEEAAEVQIIDPSFFPTLNESSNVIEEEIKTYPIEFSNEFGSIKVFVEDYVENDIAIMLVFKNSNDMIFTPKEGQTLNLSIDNRTLEVYYPNTTFNWIDRTKQVMILFKKDNE